MSEKEINDLWSNQRPPSPKTDSEISDWISQRRKREVASLAGVIIACTIGITVFTFRLLITIFDARYTLANSSIEILIAAIPALAAIISTKQYLRTQREVKAASSSVRGYLQYSLDSIRKELRQIRMATPVLAVGIAAALVAGRWQSVASGRETFENAASGLAFSIALLLAGFAVLYHWYHAFLKPSEAYLARTLDLCERDTEEQEAIPSEP